MYSITYSTQADADTSTVLGKAFLNAALTGFAALLIVVSAQAAPVVAVNWSGDYVGSNTAMNYPTPVTTGSTVVYAYNAATPINPSTGYTAPVGKTGPFYGGSYISSTGAATTWSGGTEVRQAATGNGDRLRYNRSGVGGRALSGAAFTDVLKTDFLNGASSQTLSFAMDSGSPVGSLSLNIIESVNATYRFAVLNAGQWYLSSVSTSSTGAFGITSANILSSTWGAWSPTGGTNGRLADVPSTFATLGNAFMDIQGFGYYVGFSAGDGANITSSIDLFTAQALAAVPEPQTYVLMAVGLSLIMWRLRRVRKNS